MFVDNHNITTTQTRLEPVLKLTPGDEQRYQHLSNIRCVARAIELLRIARLLASGGLRMRYWLQKSCHQP